MKYLIIGLLVLMFIASCAVNSVNSVPDEDKFINIEGTPAYVLVEPNKSMELINDDIYICSAEVEEKIRRIKVPMKVVGGVYGTAGLLALIDLATTGGVFASFFYTYDGCNNSCRLDNLCFSRCNIRIKRLQKFRNLS